MDIVSIDKTGWYSDVGWRGWDVLAPSFLIAPSQFTSFGKYEVQKGEDMRLDLVMMSIYNDAYLLENMDVILYINGIDNPLNIREGMILYYPDNMSFDNFRYLDVRDPIASKSIKESLGVVNKTTRKDENRKKFLDADYSLPPTVLRESKPPVRVADGNIIVGGL